MLLSDDLIEAELNAVQNIIILGYISIFKAKYLLKALLQIAWNHFEKLARVLPLKTFFK